MESETELPASVSESSSLALVAFALGHEGETGAWEFGLLFTTDDRIQAMHREFMNLDSPTDILTFPYEPDEFEQEAEPSRGGDIVISVDTASINAADADWNLADELRFLTLHGVLHILGWDDVEPDQRATMLARQATLLERWIGQAGDAAG